MAVSSAVHLSIGLHPYDTGSNFGVPVYLILKKDMIEKIAGHKGYLVSETDTDDAFILLFMDFILNVNIIDILV